MSNPLKKTISIKKLSEIRPEHHNNEEGHEREHQATSSLEVNRLEQQILDLTKQKENMLADLRESINHEKEKWLEEKENERKEAHDTGYQEGYREGTKEAQRLWQEKLDKVNELTDQAKQDYFRTIEKHEDAITQLAIASAEKILHHELRSDADQFLDIIKEAIKDLKDDAYIHIEVHPDEYDLVVKQKAELEQIVGTKNFISVYTNPELAEFDCIIKYPNGRIDAGVDLQLRQIKNVLAEKVMEES